MKELSTKLLTKIERLETALKDIRLSFYCVLEDRLSLLQEEAKFNRDDPDLNDQIAHFQSLMDEYFPGGKV